MSFGAIWAFLSSNRVNTTSFYLCARTKGKGQIELKIEENTFLGKVVKHFQFGSCTSFRFIGDGRQRRHSC